MSVCPRPGTFILRKGSLSFFFSAATSRYTIEDGIIVDICAQLHNEPFTYIPVKKGKFDRDEYGKKPNVCFDNSGPFGNLRYDEKRPYELLFFDEILETAASLLKLYFKQGPQKAVLSFIWCTKGLVHKDVIQKIARLIWDSRMDMHLWARANRFHMPYY